MVHLGPVPHEERHDRRDLLEPKPRGVNLGGWLVLEPWVTPSLFYQFEGRPANETAMDMHGFCRVLGAQEANRQLRIHWEKWVTQEHLAELRAAASTRCACPSATGCGRRTGRTTAAPTAPSTS